VRAPANAPGSTHVHVIAHTHWDREWYLTREQYRARLVDLIDRVLDRMSAEPAFTCFHLDGQAIVIEDYLEVRPDREPELRGRVAEGRLLVGPWYVMPDMFLVSGEALVRNLARGLRLAADAGRAMRVGYMPDPFGHVAQMPQILVGLGLEGAILWRGFGGPRAEYLWEAPDGSRVLLLHLPREGYCNGLRLPLLPADAGAVVARERDRSVTNQVLLMVGVDHVEPHPGLLRLIASVDHTPGTTATLSTLPAYVEAVKTAVASRPAALEVVRGELRGGEDFAHLLPGVLSTRTYLKQANAHVQRELERWAEPTSVFAAMCGAPPATGLLRHAWKTLLQNHPHDSICGCSIDPVHEENVTRFAIARQVAEIVTDRAVRSLASRLPPSPEGTIRCVAVNTDASPWSGVIEATVEIPLEPMDEERDFDLSHLEVPLVFFGAEAAVAAVTDHQGQPLDFQVLDVSDDVSHRMSRYVPPVAVRVRRVRLAVRLPDLPSLGCAALDVHVGPSRPAATALAGGARAEGRALENDVIRLEVGDDGTVHVTDKRSATGYSSLFAFDDVGDVGDEYNYSPPASNVCVTSAHARDVRVRPLEEGPLCAALLIELVLPVPAAAAADRTSRSSGTVDIAVALEVRIRAGSPLVEGVVRVDNRARDHRLRVLFDTGARVVDAHRADTAFGIVERPSRKAAPPGALVETPVDAAPMQSFVDAGDATAGAVVVADGLMEYEVVSTGSGAATALTVLRSVGALSRDDLVTRPGHAGPGLPTPGAQCLGPHAFRVAFVPRTAPPPAGALFGIARRFLAPPRLFSSCGGDGSLPAVASFLHLGTAAGTNVVLSACKPADDRSSVILRVFEAAGGTEALAVSAGAPVRAAYLADLAEHRQEACRVDGNRVELPVGPSRIVTLELELEGR